MSLSSPLVVLTWGLMLASAAVAAAPESGPLEGVRRIELRDAMESVPDIHIGPGLSTTVLFDSPIRPDEVVLDGRERFQRLGMSEDHLVLVPSSTFRHGERFRLEVRFRDGASPERAALSLVVDATQVERQVELYRHRRPAESYRQEVEELKTQMARLQQELARRLPPDASADRGAALLWETLVRWEDLERWPLPFQRVTSPAPLFVRNLMGVRLKHSWEALQVRLETTGEAGSWRVTGASLQDERGRSVQGLHLVDPGPAARSGTRDMLVAVTQEAVLPRGRYTLKLWNADTGQSLTVEGINVP